MHVVRFENTGHSNHTATMRPPGNKTGMPSVETNSDEFRKTQLQGENPTDKKSATASQD